MCAHICVCGCTHMYVCETCTTGQPGVSFLRDYTPSQINFSKRHIQASCLRHFHSFPSPSFHALLLKSMTSPIAIYPCIEISTHIDKLLSPLSVDRTYRVSSWSRTQCRLDGLAGKPQASTCLCPPLLELQSLATQPAFFHGFWGSQRLHQPSQL